MVVRHGSLETITSMRKIIAALQVSVDGFKSGARMRRCGSAW